MIATLTKVEPRPTHRLSIQTTGREANSPSKQLGGLVLARQVGESLIIGDSIRIEVLSLKSNAARVRVIAPRAVAVHRREVFDAIRLESFDSAVRKTPQEPFDLPVDFDPLTATGGLVLSRRAGETIIIGGEIAVDVVEARPGVVRFRIIAPRSVSIYRREVYEAIQRGERV